MDRPLLPPDSLPPLLPRQDDTQNGFRDANRLLHEQIQSGVWVHGPVGVSVAAYLAAVLGLSDRETEEIQTIFLNFRPVDDLETTPVADGAILALSAAMPGLMGATMRRAGTYAKLRESISHCGTIPGETSPHAEDGQGWVKVKAFNAIVPILTQKLTAVGCALWDGRDYVYLPPEA